MKTYVHLWWYLAKFFLEGEIFQATVAEKIKTRFVSKNRAVYEIMCKNMVEPDRPQMTV